MSKVIRKIAIISSVALILSSSNVYAKTFYGEMKDNLTVREDFQKHYNFHRRLGSLVRYAPSEYQLMGLVGLTTVSFVTKEVFWDLIFRQGDFDMKDAAANFKGIKDGMNGRNALEENEFRKTLQNVNALTEQLIKDTQEEVLVQRATIRELQDQYKKLQAIQELRQVEPVVNKTEQSPEIPINQIESSEKTDNVSNADK